MKQYFYLVFLALVTLCPGLAFAFDVPAPSGYVTDTMGAIKPDQLAALNSKIHAFNTETKNEIGALVIPTIGSESIEDIAHQTFQSWKVGKAGLDNGVLIVIAVNSRKFRIQTGKGVEGDLPDLSTSDVGKKMVPFLKKNDVYGALNIAVDDIKAKLESRRNQKADPGSGATFTHQSNQSNDQQVNSPSCDVGVVGGSMDMGWIYWGVGLVLVMAIAWLVSSVRKRNRNERARAEELATQRKREAEERRVSEEREFQAARRRRAEELKMHTDEQQKVFDNTVDELKSRLAREAASGQKNPVVTPPRPRSSSTATKAVVGAGAVAAAGYVAHKVSQSSNDEEKRRERERRERQEREARERRDREEQEERDRKNRESSSSSSSYDSGPSIIGGFDWGGGSSGGNSGGGDSGGGFGGGDSGGGGSSGDW